MKAYDLDAGWSASSDWRDDISKMEDSAQDGGDFEDWTYLAGVRLYF